MSSSARQARPKPPLGWTLLALVLAAACLAASFPGWSASLATLFWMAAALGLELTAVRLPGFGFFCAAPALYLGGSGSAFFGGVGVVSCLLAGAVARAGRGSDGRAELCHALPSLAAATVTGLWPVLLGQPSNPLTFVFATGAYLGLERGSMFTLGLASLTGSARIGWLRLRRTLVAQHGALLAAAACLSILAPSVFWLPLALAPVLWTTHQAAANALFRVQATLALETEQKAQKLSVDLRETRSEKRLLEGENRQLEGEVSQLSTLLSASRQFASTLDRRKLCKQTRDLAIKELGTQAGGVFWGDLALAWGGPGPENLTGLLGSSPTPPPGYAGWRVEPLPREGQDYGHLVLLWSGAVRLGEERRRLLSALAYSLGMALENAERYEQVTRAQEQLVESSKLRAVGQLAAGVAHELNSPLGAIRLALESLESQPLNDTGTRRLGRAQGACQRAQGIVDKLLVYSREKKSAPKPFPLREAVEDAVVFLSASMQQRQVRLVTETSGEARIEGSAPEIQQVMINLVLNAADAYEDRPPSERRVLLGCRDEGRYGVFWVEDRAGGIAPEVAQRVFEPFFTTKPVGQGTGLGLSISREIVTAHGGEISYRPVQGGSIFAVRFPSIESAETAMPG